MYRRGVFWLKIWLFPKSRAGENERKTALLWKERQSDSKTGKAAKL